MCISNALMECGCVQGSKVEGRHLSEEDLKLVAKLGNLLTQRPQGPRGQTMNHKVVKPLSLSLSHLCEHFSATAMQQGGKDCACGRLVCSDLGQNVTGAVRPTRHLK